MKKNQLKMDFVDNVTPQKVKLLEQLTPRPQVFESTAEPGILNANHPLLEKFQASLRAHLLRVQHKLEEEIADIDHSLNVKKDERENLGAELYDLQQKIHSQRQTMEEILLKSKESTEKRAKHEENIKFLRENYDELNDDFKKKKQRHNEHLVNLDNLQVLENNIDKWAKEIQNEIEVAKRVVSKDTQDKIAVADEKRKTDMFLYNMETELRKRENELGMLTDQIKEQDVINKTLIQCLVDANIDLDSLQTEHKRLMLAWNQVIVGVEQRDKVLADLHQNLEYFIFFIPFSETNIN